MLALGVSTSAVTCFKITPEQQEADHEATVSFGFTQTLGSAASGAGRSSLNLCRSVCWALGVTATTTTHHTLILSQVSHIRR